jgi:TupA-like ATPgrasp
MNFKYNLSKIIHLVGGVRLNYSLRYIHNRKRFPNFRNPKDLSERILASMLSPSFTKFAKYVDKVGVREYILEKGLGNILLEHYGVWENPEDIDFSKLPDKFALKTNNGVGNHIFCKDKSKLDKEDCINKLKNNLEIIQSIESSLEPQYKSIPPLVFCEELIDTGTDAWPVDYKFTCINGEPDHVFFATERETKVKYNTFDLDWNFLPYTIDKFKPLTYPEKPKYVKEMADIARILSKDFEFVRVDLYEHGDRIIFGELTFSPWGGFMYSYTNESIKLLGNKFNKKYNL